MSKALVLMYLLLSITGYCSLLLHEESVDGLLFPDELDNQSVQVDKQSPTKTAGNTAETQIKRLKGILGNHIESGWNRWVWACSSRSMNHYIFSLKAPPYDVSSALGHGKNTVNVKNLR